MKKPKLILIWSSQGGAGKSTAIHNISTALSSKPFSYEILVGDADKQASLAVIESETHEVTEISTKAVVDSFDKVEGYDFVFIDMAGFYDEESVTAGEHVEQIISMAHTWFIPYTTDQFSIMGAYQTYELLAEYATRPVVFFENIVQRRTTLHQSMNKEMDELFSSGEARKMKAGLPQYQIFKQLPSESIYNGSIGRRQVVAFRSFINEFNKIINEG